MSAIRFGNAASMLLMGVAMAAAPQAFAQEAKPEGDKLEAQAGRTASFNIPAQPLAQALTGLRPPVGPADRRRFGRRRRQDAAAA